jgi:amino acid transporter
VDGHRPGRRQHDRLGGVPAAELPGLLSVFWGALATNALLAEAGAVAAIWALTFVNALGIRHGGWVQAVTTAPKLVPLLAIATVGLLFLDGGNFGGFNPSGGSVFGSVTAAALTLWAFIGLESATIPAGVLAGSNAPFADAATEMFGGWAGDAVAVGAIVSAFGALNGWILLQGQIPLAAAQLMLLATDRAAFSGRRLAGDALVALLAFGYSLWAIAGAGYEVVFKGFLLLAGIPVYVWLRWRATRAPAEAAPLTVEDLLPPIADKQPVRS